jgi:hypothetical protein
MCGKFGANRDNVLKKIWPLTLNDVDLDQIWPHRNEPLKGNSRVTKFCEIGPKDVGEKQMWPLGPTTLTFAETNP